MSTHNIPVSVCGEIRKISIFPRNSEISLNQPIWMTHLIWTPGAK